MAGNPDLDPETSTNREIGISFDNDLIDAGVTYFHTDFRNKIEYAPLGLFTALVDAHEQRAARAHQWHGRQFQRPLRRAVALAHVGDLDEGSQNLTTGRDLIDTPEFSGYSSLDWTPGTSSSKLSAQYTGTDYFVAGRSYFQHDRTVLTGA